MPFSKNGLLVTIVSGGTYFGVISALSGWHPAIAGVSFAVVVSTFFMVLMVIADKR